MTNVDNTEFIIDSIKGKTIAIVYIFEGEDAPGFGHYHIWKSDVISKWLLAVQELHCMPLILDVRTFVEKAINRTLPHIDFVVNLNCGSTELSPMGLVPSMCGFLNIPCIPCNTVSIITGENKEISNHVAKSIGLRVPQKLTTKIHDGIYRPLNYGSSYGVKRVDSVNKSSGIYQEFIHGYDITTPFLFNPLTKKMEMLPTILYVPDNNDLEWFFDETAKEHKCGYHREILHQISTDLLEKYQNLIESLSINTFCRIDARIRCEKNIADVTSYIPNADTTYFIEMNPMPTVRKDNSFDFSYHAISEQYNISQFINILRNWNGTASVHTVLLACSMLAYIIAKY